MSSDLPSSLAGRLMTMRIIHASLVVGCLTFGVVVLLRPPVQGAAVADVPIISYTAAAFGLGAGLMALLLPGLMTASWRRKLAQGENPVPGTTPPNSEEQWWSLYQTQLIIRAALLEGVVFLALVAYMQEGQKWALGLAGVFVLLMVLLLPTRGRVDSWVARQRELVDQVRR